MVLSRRRAPCGFDITANGPPRTGGRAVATGEIGNRTPAAVYTGIAREDTQNVDGCAGPKLGLSNRADDGRDRSRRGDRVAGRAALDPRGHDGSRRRRRDVGGRPIHARVRPAWTPSLAAAASRWPTRVRDHVR